MQDSILHQRLQQQPGQLGILCFGRSLDFPFQAVLKPHLHNVQVLAYMLQFIPEPHPALFTLASNGIAE
ncbi:hypothetical protein D3C80_1857980 [compost metagenome]